MYHVSFSVLFYQTILILRFFLNQDIYKSCKESYLDRGRHYGIREKPGAREVPRDPQEDKPRLDY